VSTIPVQANPLSVAVELLRDAVPYKKGGISASGLSQAGMIYYIFQQLQIPVPQTAQGQFYAGAQVPVGPPGNLLAYAQPGDVIFQGSSNPDTETEGLVYSTGGTGTMITVPVNGVVTYSPISGAIDAIRRYSGSVSGYEGAPISATTPVYLSDVTDYIKPLTVASSDIPVQPVHHSWVPSPKDVELLILVGLGALGVLLYRRGRSK
jgi:hypothetical protein